MQPFSLFPLHSFLPKARLAIAMAVAWLGTAIAVTAQDWPQFRGPDGMGRTTATDLPLTSVESESLVGLNRTTGEEVWRAGGIKESWNTPVLVRTASGDTELVLGIFGGVLGFDPRTGEHASPAVTGNRLLIRSDRYLYCLGTK